MFLIIAISAILAVSVADPLGCCLPSRWTGLIVANEGQLSPNDTKAQAIDNVERIHYDYTKRMMAIHRHQMNTDTGVRDNVTIIYDYKNGKEHIIPHSGSCMTRPLDGNTMFNPCFPQNFTYTESYTIGSSIKNFQINSFEGMFGTLQVAMLLTAHDCYPVADKIYQTQGPTELIGGMVFMDVDPNGVDDSMFSPPANCKAGPTSIGVGKRDLALELLNLDRVPFTYPEEY